MKKRPLYYAVRSNAGTMHSFRTPEEAYTFLAAEGARPVDPWSFDLFPREPDGQAPNAAAPISASGIDDLEPGKRLD